jgi:hypothetical protein
MGMTAQQWTYCEISNTQCVLNGKVLHTNSEGLSALDFLREIFVQQGIDYAKFYKMDGLSKLGLLGVELLKREADLPEDSDEIAVVCTNKFSSLDADITHQELIEQGTASPAVFVYTLPNIVLGEIAIRNKWYGEQQFFVKNEWPGELIHKYIVTIFELNKAQQILIGKADFFRDSMEGRWVILNKAHYQLPQVWEEINMFFEK